MGPETTRFMSSGWNRTEAMERTDPIIDYRLRVILTGLIVSWFGLIVLGIWAVTDDAYSVIALVAILGSMAIDAADRHVRSVASTPRVGFRRLDHLLAWTVIALAAILAFELGREQPPSGIGFLLMTFFAAATLMRNGTLLAVGITATVAYGFAIVEYGSDDLQSALVNFLAFVAAVVFILLVSIGIRSQLERTAAAYRGAVGARDGAVPAGARDQPAVRHLPHDRCGHEARRGPARTGRSRGSRRERAGWAWCCSTTPRSEHLNLMSPIWAAGHTVQAEEFSLTLDESSVGPRVFMGGDPIVINDIDRGISGRSADG